MTVDLKTLIGKHRQKGVVIDTNLLILLLIGAYDPSHIGRFKRTQDYTREDFRLLRSMAAAFRRIVSTPNILTEACNLCLTLNAQTDSRLYIYFRALIEQLKESFVPARSVAALYAFDRFGISDASIVSLCQRGYLLITDDLPLYHYLSSLGLAAINFNHLRMAAWK